MARNKEAMIFLIDVGPSMHSVLPEVGKVCSMFIQKKLIFAKSDLVGIVLFGTKDTNNELEKEVGGYEHVFVLRDIGVVDEADLETLNLPRGTFPGDFLDAIVVGMDMLIKKFNPKEKLKKCLHLITNAQCATKEPYEGTKVDQAVTIAHQMNAQGISLNCLIFRERLWGVENQQVIDENDKLLNQFSQQAVANIVHVDSTTSLLGAIKTRRINPVTIFRGDLELSSTMKIKVWVYKKTAEEKFPTLKKYSDEAPTSDKYATHEVKVDFEYKIMEDPDKIVPPEQRIKGYRYGPQVVPISASEWEAAKVKLKKSVKLLGFTKASNISRHYYMKDVNIFIPEPGNTKAIIAVSALARAMQEKNRSAILRCVWREGQGKVIVGVLTPNLSSVDKIPDSFYFNVLPFAEDVREFQFPSLSKFSSCQPDEKQQEAADDFVKMLDLTSSNGKELLQPEYTPNPVLAQFYRFLDLKSKDPGSDIPELDNSLKKIAEPDFDILSRNKSITNHFEKQFELKENSKKRKLSRHAWRGKPSVSDEKEVGKEGEVPETQSASLVKALPSTNVEKIGDLNPVQDFEAMMKRRDSSKWTSKAIKDMKSHIFYLLENSFEGHSYQKAIECLIALREGCILEQEPREFNDFLLDMCKKWSKTDLADFLSLMPSKNITLISKIEAADSDLTEAAAKNFPVTFNESPE
ncbi:ATP-dependent DNA helicase 2 subunit KU80-like [Zingiber officinale]|uniref:ATP-dependent DNA helicase 2 subunit KU80-like n=1 Tax=Zingiber officinale TaxID=94328 RepID=UPI001C4CDA0C|nr:ATP-dependent DNA helicase 2 subunit KU80-like [Zingiber officinale]